jgi:hypothetical protein
MAAGAGGGELEALEGVRSIVLKPSESLDESRFTRIAGADFNDPAVGLEGLLASLASTGFQASNLGDAIDVVNQMVRRSLAALLFPSGGRVCAFGMGGLTVASDLDEEIGLCGFVRCEVCCSVFCVGPRANSCLGRLDFVLEMHGGAKSFEDMAKLIDG